MIKDLLPHDIYFVTGIDTDAGKSYATGYLSLQLLNEGVNSITQKLIQTGNKGVSEDIQLHRSIEKRPLQEVDLNGTTCPLVYAYPCSPHMAIALEKRKAEYEKTTEATAKLLASYDKVLLEGAGGVMVPLTNTMLTIDYIEEHQYPVILVTTAKLGSINHTLLSIECLAQRNIPIAMIVYNEAISTTSPITQETKNYLKTYVEHHYPKTHFITLPTL